MQIMVADKKLLSTSEHNLMSANPKVNIDARLWLTCRLKISQYLSDCIKIPVDESPLETEAVIGTAEYHIDQGLNEAEAFGDDELALKFSMLEIYKSLHTGDEAADIAEKLEVSLVSHHSIYFILNKKAQIAFIFDTFSIGEQMVIREPFNFIIGKMKESLIN